MEKAVVVFSGGQDSTTCLFWALEKFAEVKAITFFYGQRHSFEVACANKIAKDVEVNNKVVNVDIFTQLTDNALINKELEIKNEGKMPNTFVEGRNHLFFSFAAIYAKQIGAKHIVTGISDTDYSGYPDCREPFVRSLNETLNLAMDYDFTIHTPLMHLSKADTWELADRMGKLQYIREHTLTCYHGVIGDGCGNCPACELRNKGLRSYLDRKERKK